MRVLGIDPGKAGGAGLVGPSGYSASKLDCGGARELFNLISAGAAQADVVYLEKVSASPPQRGKQRVSGGKSMFEFGRSLGQIEMVLAVLDVTTVLVTPRQWQTEFGLYGLKSAAGEKLNQTDKKNAHKDLAEKLFPQVKKMTHAISDALLIAEYGRRVYNPKLQEAISGTTR